MRWKWLLTLGIMFTLTAYLGVWICGMVLDRRRREDLLAVPPASSESLPGSSVAEPASSIPAAADLIAPVGFEISSFSTYPGEYLVLTAYGLPQDAVIEVHNPFGDPPQWFPVDDHLSALVAVKYTYTPGEYQLTASGGGFHEEFTVLLKEKQFEEQHLTVDESVTSQTVDSNAANAEYYEKVQPKKFIVEDRPLWDGGFLLPVSGEVTTEFGMLRTVNKKPSDRHGGIDLACERGTPVAASNRGRVLFGEFIALTGNTVCIEHGLGLKTWYYHMDSLTVKTGDFVEKGQQIGTVGSTGFSTGPHLHFAVSVNNVYINPWTLIDSAPVI